MWQKIKSIVTYSCFPKAFMSFAADVEFMQANIKRVSKESFPISKAICLQFL
jgi:hypothetical protein